MEATSYRAAVSLYPAPQSAAAGGDGGGPNAPSHVSRASVLAPFDAFVRGRVMAELDISDVAAYTAVSRSARKEVLACSDLRYHTVRLAYQLRASADVASPPTHMGPAVGSLPRDYWQTVMGIVRGPNLSPPLRCARLADPQAQYEAPDLGEEAPWQRRATPILTPQLRFLYLAGFPSLGLVPGDFTAKLVYLRLHVPPAATLKLCDLPHWRATALDTLEVSSRRALILIPPLLAHTPQLRRLIVQGSALQPPGSLACLAPLGRLRSLTLEHCFDVEGLTQRLSGTLPLTVLRLRECLAMRKVPLLQPLPALSVLEISGAQLLATLPDSLATLSSLRELHLNTLPLLRELPGHWDMPKLVSFSLSGTRYIKQLPNSLLLHSTLTSLQLSDNLMLTRLTLRPEQPTTELCPQLRELHLNGCRALCAIAPALLRAPHLRSLDLTHCSALAADRVALAILRGLPKKPELFLAEELEEAMWGGES